MRAFARTRTVSRGMKIAALGAGVLVLAACSSTPASTPSETAGESSAPAASDGQPADGTLRFGTLLPQTGALSFLGPPAEAGVQLAYNDASELDLPFELDLETTDSGHTDTDIATQSASQLIENGTDVIIGPESSGVALTVIDAIAAAGVVEISPATTSPDLSEYPDNGYYWRTAPSDVLQGRVLGNLMVGDGNESVAMLVLNDPYGNGLAENAAAAVEAAGGTVVATVPFNSGETQFASQVGELLAADPDAIAVIAFEETNSIIPELVTTQGYPSDSIYFVDGNISNTYDFPEGTLEGVKATLPGTFASEEFQERLLEIDDSLEDFSYAAESYDAVTLAVLAAVQGGDDSAATIKDNLQSVSEDGTECTTMADCIDLLADGEDIDYNGQSGPITFDENGDPTQAFIGTYEYGANNRYSPLTAEFGDLAG